MSVLLFGTGMDKKLNRFFKADDSAIEALKTKMENFQLSVSKVATFNDLIYMMGITFFLCRSGTFYFRVSRTVD